MSAGADTPLIDVQPLAGEQTAAAEPGAEPRADSERPIKDKRPRKRSRKSGSSSGGSSTPPKLAGGALKARSKVLETKLGELLTFPAVPAAMLAPDPLTQGYMIEHFSRSSPRTAAALVEASETNEQLRALLERITLGGSMFTVVVALAAYAAPPIMWTIGMRESAARFTQATTMDQETLDRMMGEAYAAAEAAQQQTTSAEANGQGAAPAPEPGPFAPEP